VLAATILTAAFLVASLSIFPLFYETIDDANMNLIAAGRGYTDGPDEHLLFSNILVGIPLRWLYQVAPEVPWYGGYLVAVMSCSFLAMSLAFLLANPTVKQLLLAALVLVAYGLPCLLALQFTRVGFFAVLGGVLLWLNAALGRGPRWQAWVGGPLILLGCLVRFESGLLAGVVLAPALAWGLFQTLRSRKAAVLAAYLVVLALGSLGLQRFNRWYYNREDGWSGYFEWGPLASKFIDDQRVKYNQQTQPILEAVGWTFVDFYMLMYSGYADGERFSAEKLRTVLEKAPLSERVTSDRSLAYLRTRLLGDNQLLVVLLAGGFCIAVAGGGSARMVPLLCWVVAFGLCIVLFLYLRLPPRVYFPALGAFLPVAVWASRPRPAGPRVAVGSGLFLVGIAVFACVLTWQAGEALVLSSRKEETAATARDMMSRLAPRHDQLFLQWGDCWLPTDYLVYPLRPMAVPAGFKTLGLGADCRIPPGRRILAQFGITDVYRALVGRPDVFLLSQEIPNRLFAGYLLVHYGMHIAPEQAFDHPALRGAAFYQFHERRQAKPP
jgi:hypothetical protein